MFMDQMKRVSQFLMILVAPSKGDVYQLPKIMQNVKVLESIVLDATAILATLTSPINLFNVLLAILLLSPIVSLIPNLSTSKNVWMDVSSKLKVIFEFP